MHHDLRSRILTGLFIVGAVVACERAPATAQAGVRQTTFPGQVTAGGGTSGEVMARPSAASAAGGNQEGLRGQAADGSVAGTPSIPEGAGGTTSGAAMGGTTGAAAATQVAPPPGGTSPAVPSQEGKK